MRTWCINLCLVAAVFLPHNALAQESVIKSCSEFAEKALRTYVTFSDDRAFLDVAYSNYCAESRSYEEMSVDKKTSFNVAYKKIFRLGFGADKATDSASQHYNAFCSHKYSEVQSDIQTRSEVDTIREDALKTLNLCLRSAELRVKVHYSAPELPDDQFAITFQSSAGTRKLLGVQGRNATCTHLGQELGAYIQPPIDIGADTVGIVCTRRIEPISIYGLRGQRFPRTQVFIFTDYAPEAFEIVVEEGVTGPLMNRLEAIERKLADDTVPTGTFILMPSACPTRTYEDVTQKYADRGIRFDPKVTTDVTLGGNDGSHMHDGNHTHPATTRHTGGNAREGGGPRHAVHYQAGHATTVSSPNWTIVGGAHIHSYVGLRVCRKK